MSLRRPRSAPPRRPAAAAASTVMLDGVAIPGVDPQMFESFWKQREEVKAQNQSASFSANAGSRSQSRPSQRVRPSTAGPRRTREQPREQLREQSRAIGGRRAVQAALRGRQRPKSAALFRP